MVEHKAPRNLRTEQPNPLDFTVKDPLRETYEGRWKQLPRIQKIGLIVVLGIWVAFIAMLVLAARNSHSLGSLLPVLLVASILGVLLLVRRRKVH
jgi:flagellar biosynthesis/type III secretory pathway M-ring protein FliF/YscJ